MPTLSFTTYALGAALITNVLQFLTGSNILAKLWSISNHGTMLGHLTIGDANPVRKLAVDLASPTTHVSNHGAPPTSSVQLPAGITAAPSIPFGYHAPILVPNQFLPSTSPGGLFGCTFEFIFVASLCAFFFGICALVVFFSPARQPRWRLVEVSRSLWDMDLHYTSSMEAIASDTELVLGASSSMSTCSFASFSSTSDSLTFFPNMQQPSDNEEEEDAPIASPWFHSDSKESLLSPTLYTLPSLLDSIESLTEMQGGAVADTNTKKKNRSKKLRRRRRKAETAKAVTVSRHQDVPPTPAMIHRQAVDTHCHISVGERRQTLEWEGVTYGSGRGGLEATDSAGSIYDQGQESDV